MILNNHQNSSPMHFSTRKEPSKRVKISNILWDENKQSSAPVGEGLMKNGIELQQQQQVVIKGWVKTIRKQKYVTFLQVNDGSDLGGIQAVLESNNLSTQDELNKYLYNRFCCYNFCYYYCMYFMTFIFATILLYQ